MRRHAPVPLAPSRFSAPFLSPPPPPGESFSFGLEAEYLLVSVREGRPLWYRDLDFFSLSALVESIPVSDLPSCEGMDLNPPHRRVMPYGIEGYHVYDAEGRAVDLLPKGIEIRTPRLASLPECLAAFECLYFRLQGALETVGLRAVALSFHPLESEFHGPRQIRSAHYWPWAQQAMVTYGPDVNVGLPRELSRRLDLADLERKTDYYAPALTAFTLASPFLDGGLWNIDGVRGRSVRTFRRSVVGAAVEWHPEQGDRLEFKAFEMANATVDFGNQFLLWLMLLLDDGLAGRATPADRVRELRATAVHGFDQSEVYGKAKEVLRRAPRVLSSWGFETDSLARLEWLLGRRETPADELIRWKQSGASLRAVLEARSALQPVAPVGPDRARFGGLAALPAEAVPARI